LTNPKKFFVTNKHKSKEEMVETSVKPALVTNEDVEAAFMSTKPSAVLKVAVYEKWMNNYGSI
jgi:hypothetical protein